MSIVALITRLLEALLARQSPTPPPATPKPSYTLETRDGVIAIQQKLSELGYLDPPADGGWGPTSEWAMSALAVHEGMTWLANEPVTSDFAVMLNLAKPLPLAPGNDLAGLIIRAMLDKRYWIARHPDCVNIVYVEGMGPDGARNDNKPNQFNDIRCTVKIDKNGVPRLTGIWEATTEPGVYWTEHRMNPGGAFHIKPGQYKAWARGYHHQHEALVQVGEIDGYRDNRNMLLRDMQHPVRGSDFGVNQHGGYDLPKNDLAKSSAGCLVGRSTAGHREFMKLVKSDARYVANQNYRFMTAVLETPDVAA
jgi:hypothetical protein